MSIAILGASGQIGTFIRKQLISDFTESEIISCSRKNENGFFHFDPFNDDWKKPGQLDVIINAIGIIQETRKMNFHKAHVGLTNLILKHRELLGNPRIIQLSVLGADIKSQSQFLSTKAEADNNLLQHENTVVVRPSIVCTPGTMIVQKFKMLKKLSHLLFGYLPFPVEILKTRIQPVLGEDLSKVISSLCITGTTGIVEVGGPDKISLGELFKSFLKIKPLSINQKFADAGIGLMAKIFPGFINSDQYYLLKSDNIVLDNKVFVPGKFSFRSTKDFWREELD